MKGTGLEGKAAAPERARKSLILYNLTGSIEVEANSTRGRLFLTIRPSGRHIKHMRCA